MATKGVCQDYNDDGSYFGSYPPNLSIPLTAKFVDPPKLAIDGWEGSSVHPEIGKDQLCNSTMQPERSSSLDTIEKILSR